MTEPDADMVELAGRLFDMARAGDAERLAAYLDAGVPANLTNDNGDSLLMLAAYYGRPETVDALIARGADVNRCNDAGQTPLAGAVFHGDDVVVRRLLAAGADPRAGEPSAVDTAEMFERDEFLALFGGQ